MKSKLSPAVVSAAAANVIAALIPLSLLFFASGSSVRPIGHAAVIGLWSLICAGTLIPRSLLLLASKQWVCGIVVMVLALSPFVVSLVVLRWVVAVKGIVLES